MNRLAGCACAALLWAAVPLGADEQTWTGKISDSMCRQHHELGGEQGLPDNEHDCTLVCVKSGSKFVLVVDDAVYNLANQSDAALAENAGYTVKVTGELKGKSIAASKIELISK
jgi:hypothetical protein